MKLSDEIQDYLKQSPFALIIVKLDLGKGEEGLIIVKGSDDLLMALKEDEAEVNVGWLVEQTDFGPVACMTLVSGSEKTGRLVGESYFDIFGEEDRTMLELLASQERLKAAMFGEEMNLCYLADVEWRDLDRLMVEQVADRAEELGERADELDFTKAKELFQEEFSLDILAESVFTTKGVKL